MLRLLRERLDLPWTVHFLDGSTAILFVCAETPDKETRDAGKTKAFAVLLGDGALEEADFRGHAEETKAFEDAIA